MKDNIQFEEFMNEPLNMEKRKQLNFSDELVFRKAKIYKVLGPKDDRLQVQVLPELQDIDDEEMNDLPKYPPFFKGNVITGLDHVNDGAKAEYVWVICTPDLNVGYVLGKCNLFGENDKRYIDSYSYKDIRSYLASRRALPEDFDYRHLTVIQWISSSDGGMINCYNYLTGDWVLLNTSGSVLTVQQKEIYLRVGTPPSPLSAGPSAFSAIKMTSDKIWMKAPNIELDGQQIILGKHGLKLAGLPGMAPSNDNGIPVLPVMNISV